MYYADKRSLLTVVRAEEDGILHTINGDFPVNKGNIISTNQFGNQSVMTESYFYEYHEPVRKIRKKRNKPNIEDIAKGYAEMGYLVDESNKNNENYIFETNQLTQNKAL